MLRSGRMFWSLVLALSHISASQAIIIDGFLAKRSTMKHHVNLYFLKVGKYGTFLDFQCGGTLIATKLVLSAAHCFHDRDCDPWDRSERCVAVVGVEGDVSESWKRALKGKQQSDIDTYVTHHDYVRNGNQPQEYESPIEKFDIAVAKTKESFLQDEFTKPIKMARESFPYNTFGRVCGIGATGAYGKGLWPIKWLLCRNMERMEYEVCRAIGEITGQPELTEISIEESGMFCTFPGVCTGDSGGALTYNDTVVGIVSMSTGRCNELERERILHAALFIDIPTVYDWVMLTVQREEWTGISGGSFP